MFLTMDEYTDMGGIIEDESLFERLEYKAASFVNRSTFNRIRDETPVRESVKRCVFELIGLFDVERQADEQGVGISSVSNDGVSVSYSASRDTDVKTKAAQIVRDYLAMEEICGGITLLYKGVFT